MAFDLLFSPIKVVSAILPNSLVMPPMTTNLAGEDGVITDRAVAYYAARVQGGVGMVEVEHAVISIERKRLHHNAGIRDDKHIDGLSRLAGVIREAGSVATIQNGHRGRASHSALLTASKNFIHRSFSE